MISIFALALSDAFLLGLLIYEREYLMLQSLAASQVFLLLLLLPFYVRGETRMDLKNSVATTIVIAGLIVGLVAGIILSIGEFWQTPSNLSGEIHLLVLEHSELLTIVAAVIMGTALSAAGFLRGRS